MRKVWKALWAEVWDFYDFFYAITGKRIQVPIEWVFPNHCEWVFRQMTGLNGEEIGEPDNR